MEAKQNYNTIHNKQPLHDVEQTDRKIMELRGNFSRMLSGYQVLFYTAFEYFMLIRQITKSSNFQHIIGSKDKTNEK